MRGSTFIIAEWESAAIIGKARMVCAIIIAEGEYNKPIKPSGPLLDRIR
jgi:hypothetical protein